MSWRLAQSLVVLRDQIDAMYPDRDKRTDGVISGYPGAISGHNVNAAGVVCAMDITTGDYPGGITMAQSYPLADAIRNELLVAPRGLYTYLIHHMEPPYVPTPGPYIAHGGPASLWQWIPYAGTDPHTSHIHVSVDEDIPTGGAGSGEDPYDMTDPWNLGGVSTQSGTITPIQEAPDLDTAQNAALAEAWQNSKDIKATLGRLQQILEAVDVQINNRTTGNVRIAAELIQTRINQAKRPDGSPYLLACQGDIDNLAAGLVSVARGIGDLKNEPAAAAPAIDVPALAAQIAAALNTTQAHDFLVAFHNALPAN